MDDQTAPERILLQVNGTHNVRGHLGLEKNPGRGGGADIK